MRKKITVLLIFALLNCHINVFAEVFQDNDRNDLEIENSEYDLATDSQAEREENVDEGNGEEEESRAGDDTYMVSFPANIHAYLDPGNLSGKGQVFSDAYFIKNYGDEDLFIKIKNIDINCLSDEYIYEFTDSEVTDEDEYSKVKKLNINMLWRNESEGEEKLLNILDSEPNQYVLCLKAAEYDENGEFVSLNDSSIGSFYFTGTLTSNPNLAWEDGEITLRFDYEIVSGEIEEEEEQLDENLEEDLGTAPEKDSDDGNKEKSKEESEAIKDTIDSEEINQRQTEETTETAVDENNKENNTEFAQEAESVKEDKEEEHKEDINLNGASTEEDKNEEGEAKTEVKENLAEDQGNVHEIEKDFDKKQENNKGNDEMESSAEDTQESIETESSDSINKAEEQIREEIPQKQETDVEETLEDRSR